MVMKNVVLSLLVLFFLSGCGPVTEYDGVFDSDEVEVDEEMLLDVDEDIMEEQ